MVQHSNAHLSKYGRMTIGCLMILLTTGVARAWDPYRDVTGRTIRDDIKHKGEKLKTGARKFIHDPLNYLVRLPQSLIADICSAPIQQYERELQRQARGRWRTLPPVFIDAVQAAYSVDLSKIRYAVDINTLGNMAQTFGDRIYFPRALDARNCDDVHWMLHELEHTVQYSRAEYRSAGKLCEYAMKSVGAGFEHDRIDMERAADRKADWVVDYACWVMNNGAPPPIVTANTLPLNQMLVYNDTDIEVEFVMETAFTAEGPERMPPRSWTIFTAHPQDTWFNVRIATQMPDGEVQWIGYGLNGGTRQHIALNQNGAFDFFYE